MLSFSSVSVSGWLETTPALWRSQMRRKLAHRLFQRSRERSSERTHLVFADEACSLGESCWAVRDLQLDALADFLLSSLLSLRPVDRYRQRDGRVVWVG